VPPAPGMMPNFVSGNAKAAESLATLISVARVNSAPPPKAKPSTAEIVGMGSACVDAEGCRCARVSACTGVLQGMHFLERAKLSIVAFIGQNVCATCMCSLFVTVYAGTHFKCTCYLADDVAWYNTWPNPTDNSSK